MNEVDAQRRSWDLTDQIEDGIVRQMGNISNANFAMGISGTNAMMLRDALLSRDAQKFTNAVEAILKTNDMLGERERKDKLNLKRYMYGLKYMYDNRDTAAVYIANKSCSSVAFYLVTALSGRLDPLRVDFVSYWTTQFENGLLGSDSNGPGTYTKPPVAVGWWGWGGQQVSHNIPFIQKFSISLDRKYDFWAGWVPGINGGESRRWDGDGGLSALMSRYEAWRTESGHLEGQGQRWAVERRQLLGEWMKKYEKDFLPGYQALLQTNMNMVQGAMKDGVQFFVVQRRNSINDTHFMVGMNISGTLYLLDHNKVYRKEGQDPYWWGVTYASSKHNIVRWMWW